MAFLHWDQSLKEQIKSFLYTSAAAAKSLQSWPTLCDLIDCNLPGSSVHGFSRQEYWSGLPFPSPGDLPDPRIEPTSPALAGGFFTTSHLGSPILMERVTDHLVEEHVG